MSMLSLWRKISALLLVLMLAACGGAGSSAAPPTGGITLTPGNGQVTVTWAADPGVQYWMMYAPTTGTLDINNPPIGHLWVNNITSPYVVTGLTNGTTYAFAMNGRTGGGKGGAQTVSQSTVPVAAGTHWIAGTGTAATNVLRGTSYGVSTADSLNYFVSVGDGGVIYKTQDTVSQSLSGYLWSLVTPATAIATDFRAAIYTLSQFVAVGANGTVNNVFHSTDLTTWTAASTTISTGLNALASNGSTLVAVGDGGKVYYTTDAITWTAATGIPGTFTANLNGVAYSSALGWVAVGQGGALITSPDLLTWTVGTSNAGANDLNGVAITSGNIFVAVGNNGTVVRSTDGITWTLQTFTGTGNLYAVNTDSLLFLAAGQSGTAFTSVDGATWSTVASTGTTNDVLSIYGSTTKYMIVGKSGTTSSSIN